MAPAAPVFGQLNIVSGDLDKSIAFYRLLGVETPTHHVWRTKSGAHHASTGVATDGASIHMDFDSAVFAQHWNRGWSGRSDLTGRIVLGFEVATREDVDALHDKIVAAGHPSLQAPWDAFWGARYAVVEDPDGIAVGLMSPISADRKYPPPDV